MYQVFRSSCTGICYHGGKVIVCVNGWLNVLNCLLLVGL